VCEWRVPKIRSGSSKEGKVEAKEENKTTSRNREPSSLKRALE
jgi:hypothetical protein